MADEAPRVSRKKGLLVRLTVAPAVMAFLFGVLAWHASTGHAYGTDVVLVLFAAGAAYEVAAMTAKAGRPAHLAIAVAFAGALAGLGLFAPASPALRSVLRSLFLAGAVLAVFVRHLRTPQPGDLDRLLATVFPVVFVGYLFGLLRELGDGSDGAKRILFVTFASKASDIGGWVVGKTLGRHKMIPSVSPGKTWEGTAGGLAFSAAAAAGVLAIVGPLPGFVTGTAEALLLGLCLGAASIFAGLTQSALKRRCGVKDSSALLPEMGGLLDMIDSILLAAPVALLWSLLR